MRIVCVFLKGVSNESSKIVKRQTSIGNIILNSDESRVIKYKRN